jgi:hypothetical protein
VFARIVTFQWKSNMIDEAVRIYKENVTPARQSKKGSRTGYFLTDRKTGKGIAITLWDNEEDIIATEESGFFQEQLAKFNDCLTAPPVREIFEVSAQG